MSELSNVKVEFLIQIVEQGIISLYSVHINFQNLKPGIHLSSRKQSYLSIIYN